MNKDKKPEEKKPEAKKPAEPAKPKSNDTPPTFKEKPKDQVN